MKHSQAILYGLVTLLMASPAAIPFEGRRYWMPQFGLGLLALIVLTIRAGAFRPRAALLLLLACAASGWLAFLIYQARLHVLHIYGENWRDEPFVGLVLFWFLLLLLGILYFPAVFIRGIFRGGDERRQSLAGIALWVLHTTIVVWYVWMLQEVY
jgi:hypothetical protein